ncbi:hypothetical protein B0H13DRAFT_508754 [Mycena leptocephala]|nr:hypothetical protein B0H13DRAFT_508754 [Mycena leptocephala]
MSGDALHNSEQRFPAPLCHPHTRIAVQNTIQVWAADTEYLAPSVMWLYGPAGAGKSAVAQSMAEHWAATNQLTASFFFGRWRAGGGSGKSLFPTIAYQLALHTPGLRHSIGLAVEADPAICDKALEPQFQTLIVDPISLLPTIPSTPYLVIIDGLDECDSKPMQSRIIKLISQALVEYGLPMKFLLCSRPEPHIRETFDSLANDVHFRRLVLDETFSPGRDILRFLRDRFSEIRRRRIPYQDASWPSERDLERLVHSASGQFIYAATVVKFVDDEYSHPVDQLCTVLSLSATETGKSPFSDLDALHTHILSANPNVSLMMRVFSAYLAIPNPDNVATHCVGFLDRILGLRTGTVRFALRGLHSILFIPDADDQLIRVHHASLHDFLSNPARAGKFYLSQEAHLDLGRCCLLIVKNGVRHPERYPLDILDYAQKHWSNHYIPVREQHCMIQECFQSFRDVLPPTELNILCRDVKGMTARFLLIISFLESFDDLPTELCRNLDDTWNILLTTLFDPIRAVLTFYEDWGVIPHSDGFNISSSLGTVFQDLWGLDVQSRSRIRTFLSCSPSPQIRCRAADISMALLMCR